MRCPKCGYISFDHNQICPKCNKDISDEQAKLNLPTYKNNPPSLLGMLVGAGDESNVGFTLDSDAALRDAGVGLDFEDASSMMESDDIDFSDDQDLEISLNDETGEFELPEISLDGQSGDESDIDLGTEDEDLSLDMDEASFEDSDDTSDNLDEVSFEDGDDTADDLNLDLGEVSIDEEGDVADSLDGISPNESIVLEGISDSSSEALEETMEMDSVSNKDARPEIEHSKSTIELNVSDLKINETGELEISSIPDEIVSPGKLPEEDETNIDESDIDSAEDLEQESADEKTDGQNTTGALELSDLSLDAADDIPLDEVGGTDTAELPVPEGLKTDEEGLDLGDLAIKDGTEGDSFDLAGLKLDESQQGLNENETGELNASDFEINKSEEPAAMDTEKTLGLDDDITINLENLDLDLNLDDSEDDK